jgi:serine/threonine protein kinase/predicted Zn-dependent protease
VTDDTVLDPARIDRYQRLDALLDAVEELDTAAQEAYLDATCAGEPDLRAEASRFLAGARRAPASFLEGTAVSASGLAAEPPRAPQHLAGYRLLGLLGSGGMGEVYLGEDERLGRRVALKMLPAELADDPSRTAGLLREAQAVSGLNHPNILTLYDVVEGTDSPCLVLEHVDGESLRQRLQRGRLMPLEAVEVACQVVAALRAAHAAGFIHRDIKPANVMLRRDGVVKVLDFGIAKLIQPSTDPSTPAQEPTQSAPGAIVGTRRYMSPEQAAGGPVDGRSDLYALGVLLDDLVADRPPELARIVERLLRPEPSERYPDAAELLRDLTHLRLDLQVASREGSRATLDVEPGRERRWRAWRRRRVTSLAFAALLLGALGALWLRGFGAPTAGLGRGADGIVLAAFENRTGEPVFDETLGRALAAYLEPSPHLFLFPETGVRRTLAYMRLPADRLVDRELAREICQRNGVEALVTGRIAAVGNHYALTLEAEEAESGRSLARAVAEAGSREQVLGALQQAAGALRRQLGESMASVRAHDAPPEQATTGSLEAWREFALARREIGLGNFRAAVPLLEEALRWDPQFASAAGHLSQAYAARGDNVREREYAALAYALRERVSEREALFLTHLYERTVDGDLEQATVTLQRWRLLYPRDATPGLLLAETFELLGRYEEAVVESRAAVALQPLDADANVHLGLALAILGRTAEAEAVARQAKDLGLSVSYLRVSLDAATWLTVDEPARRRETERARGLPYESLFLARGALWSSQLGQLERARELSDRAIELAASRDRGIAERYGFESALRMASYGRCGDTAQLSRRTLELSTRTLGLADSPWPVSGVAMAEALCGHVEEARQRIDRLAAAHPRDTLIQRVSRPAIEAWHAFTAGDFDLARQKLATTAAYESGLYAALWPVFIRGRIELAAGRPAEAARDFARVVEEDGLRVGVAHAPAGAMARLYLARAENAAGRPEEARQAYDALLARWATADPGLDVLAAARAERAALTAPAAPKPVSP